MTAQDTPAVAPAAMEQLAELVGLVVPEKKLTSLATRFQAMQSGAAMVNRLALHDVEPAVVFALEPY